MAENTINSHSTVLSREAGGFFVELLPMTDGHLPLLYAWNQMPEILYWCEGDDILTHSEEEVREIYGGVSEHAFMFIIRVDGAPVGECWLQDMNMPLILRKYPDKTVKRIDMTIYDKSLWGKGLGREIIAMLLDFGFTQCGADYIYAMPEDYNERSQRCAAAAGFILDEVEEHEPTTKGKYTYYNVMSKELFAEG